MITHNDPDPFQVLGVPIDADDAAVRAAFHARVRAGTADAAVNTAYAAIRSEADRFATMWTHPGVIQAPRPVATPIDLPMAELARELAFLSDWELGTDGP